MGRVRKSFEEEMLCLLFRLLYPVKWGECFAHLRWVCGWCPWRTRAAQCGNSVSAPALHHQGKTGRQKQFQMIKIIKHGHFNECWSYCLLSLMSRKAFYPSTDVTSVYYFCSTWWPIGNFPLLVVNDSISSAVAPPHLVTKQIVAPSGGITALQHWDACGTLSTVRWGIILHLHFELYVNKLSVIPVVMAIQSCSKFTSNSRLRGWVVLLAHTLRRLSISKMRMKFHTGFCFCRQPNVSSPGSATSWNTQRDGK